MSVKFNNSSFSRPRDIIGASKFKAGHVTLTTPFLRVTCHPYAKTLHSLHAGIIWLL